MDTNIGFKTEIVLLCFWYFLLMVFKIMLEWCFTIYHICMFVSKMSYIFQTIIDEFRVCVFDDVVSL